MADAGQVIDVLRNVLLEHMNEGLPHYQVQSAVYIDRYTGRVIGDQEIIAGADPYGLLLTMRDGSEYKLTFENAIAEPGLEE